MDFEALRDQLLHQHTLFDAQALKDLAFVDLIRAAIGDAGAASCSLDLVRAERARRVLEAAEQLTTTRGPILMDPALLEAAQRCLDRSPLPPPEWSSLSAITRAFFLLRCLRSHLDDPLPRLTMLHDVLEDILNGPGDYPVRAYALLIQKVLDAERNEAAHHGLSILQFRKETFRLYQFLKDHVPLAELAIRQQLELTGYHCTYGCFLPGVM